MHNLTETPAEVSVVVKSAGLGDLRDALVRLSQELGPLFDSHPNKILPWGSPESVTETAFEMAYRKPGHLSQLLAREIISKVTVEVFHHRREFVDAADVRLHTLHLAGESGHSDYVAASVTERDFARHHQSRRPQIFRSAFDAIDERFARFHHCLVISTVLISTRLGKEIVIRLADCFRLGGHTAVLTPATIESHEPSVAVFCEERKIGQIVEQSQDLIRRPQFLEEIPPQAGIFHVAILHKNEPSVQDMRCSPCKN